MLVRMLVIFRLLHLPAFEPHWHLVDETACQDFEFMDLGFWGSGCLGFRAVRR